MKSLSEAHFATLRRHMVEVIDIEFDLASEEIGKAKLGSEFREALLTVPRHLFVPPQLASLAYQDTPLPIGFGKTISQPFISAAMIELLDLHTEDRVLEIGTGLGYQTALLAALASDVFSVDVVEEFITLAGARLGQLGCANLALRIGDGTRGWNEAGPFDAILVSAAAREMPVSLVQQLKPGGRIVIPLGEEGGQRLVRARREDDLLIVREIMAVEFTALETLF